MYHNEDRFTSEGDKLGRRAASVGPLPLAYEEPQ
jgi:hypothetical protein